MVQLAKFYWPFRSVAMSSRQKELSSLQDYIKEADKEVTMILQSLQWDRKVLLQCKPKSTCKYNANHKILPENLKEHEEKCVLQSQGYAKDDVFLPDVLDVNSNTVLKLTLENIKEIINYASTTDPLFKRGDANVVSEPLTLERLQATYTADERRAIYDVVVNAGPSSQDLSDVALTLTGAAGGSQKQPKSKAEQLAALRDLRRRRARYRGAPSKNYSHTLRGLIDAHMEMYAEAQGHVKSKSLKDENGEDHIRFVTSENNIKKHDGEFSKEKRNYYDQNKRKHDNDDEWRSCKSEKGRYQHSYEERGKHTINNDRSRKEERNKTYREEIDNRKYDRYYNKSKKSERNSDSYSNFQERDRYSSSSRDRQRYRESEREGRYYDGRSSERHQSERKSEQKRYYKDTDHHKKEREYSHRERRKHREY